MGIANLEDIIITKLDIFSNQKGNIMHIIKNTDNAFINFGEAYFSWILMNNKKGWKMHKEMTLNLCVPCNFVAILQVLLDYFAPSWFP